MPRLHVKVSFRIASRLAWTLLESCLCILNAAASLPLILMANGMVITRKQIAVRLQLGRSRNEGVAYRSITALREVVTSKVTARA
jgi:hypothetical protein